MRFICLGYADPAFFASRSKEEMEKSIEACFAYDDELRRGGHFAGGEALEEPKAAVTVRPGANGVEVTDGPYAETKEFLGGILVLEARDLNHAIALMSKHPGVQFGGFEIRPADETIHALIEERIAASRA